MYKKIIEDSAAVILDAHSNQTSFLRNNYKLSVYTQPLSSDYTIYLKLGEAKVVINNIKDLLPFVEIDTLDKFQKFILFAVIHNLAYATYPEGYISGLGRYDFLCNVEGVTDELKSKFDFKPDTWEDLHNYHYKMECDCLCDRRGKLARVCFELKDKQLITTEKVYTEKSEVEYEPYE